MKNQSGRGRKYYFVNFFVGLLYLFVGEGDGGEVESLI